MARITRIFSIIVIALLGVLGVGVAGLFLYAPSPSQGFAFSAAGKTIQLPDGRTLAYLEVGAADGRPVFYFHGGPGSRLEGLLFDEASRDMGIRLIAIDRPGYGLSDFQQDRSYLDWPGDVAALADHLGIVRFGTLGWSTGGPYAAVVAHAAPQRLAVTAIVAGEGPYAADDFPAEALNSDTFSGSATNKLFIWSAQNAPWLMHALFRTMRVFIFNDPIGIAENADQGNFSAQDIAYFAQPEFAASTVEAFRQGAAGVTRDFAIERREWPFALDAISGPPVLVFHGADDAGVHPSIADYVCGRIPTCRTPVIFPGRGHSVIYFQFTEIIEAMLDEWE
ncbi:MAG: alpha/beta hydrolase [Yoonia sp.]|nr:alpha/beta hydrolase [Yoonia sp.]